MSATGVKAKLQALRVELSGLPAHPWTEIGKWAEKARPFFKQHLPAQSEDFARLAEEPRYPSPILTSSSSALLPATAEASARISSEAKAKLLSFVDSVLDVIDDPDTSVKDVKDEGGAKSAKPDARVAKTKTPDPDAADATKNERQQDEHRWLVPAGFVLGVLAIIAIVALIVAIPEPTDKQFVIFRIVIALGGAGFAVALTGFIAVSIPIGARGYVRAGGTLAVFVTLYLLNPATKIVGGGNSPVIKVNHGTINIDYNSTGTPSANGTAK